MNRKRKLKWIGIQVVSVLFVFSLMGCSKEETPQEDIEVVVDSLEETGDTLENIEATTTETATNMIEGETLSTEGNAEAEAAIQAELPEEVVVEATLSHVPFVADKAPEVHAKAAILVETSTGNILYDKNIHEMMYPASMTKILTCLVVLDYFAPEELIVVGEEIYEVPWDSSKAGHQVGETFTVRNILRGLIIASGNDTANVATTMVAKRIAGDDSITLEQCEDIFADEMNQKAKSLGANNSNFVKSHGYHYDDHYTTPYDMALISMEFLKNDMLKSIAAETSYTGDSAEGIFENNDNVKTQEYTWWSHNSLITNTEYRYSGATGIKTGFTNQAGQCVAASANIDGEEMLAIVFFANDPERWLDARALFDYGYDEYEKNTLVSRGESYVTMPLTNHNPSETNVIDLVYEERITLYLPTEFSNEITTKANYYEEFFEVGTDGQLYIKAPIAANTKVGEVVISKNNKELYRQYLYTNIDVEEGTWVHKLQFAFDNFKNDIFSIQGLIGVGIVGGVIALGVVLVRMVVGRRRRSQMQYTFKQPRGRRRR
ncbi:MAG: D-alanyl-D-alanine carboxypeptidase family protein [Bacillota bacterium]